MCDPVTASVVVAATVATAAGGATYQQSYQAEKHARTLERSQTRGAAESVRRAEMTRQQGILQQQKNQEQIAKKLASKRQNMLARYNVTQQQTSTQLGNQLGYNQLAGTTTQTLG